MVTKKQSIAAFIKGQMALALVAPLLFAAAARGENDVNGNLFTLTNTPAAPNGGWSWFSGERAIVDSSDPSNPRLILSAVSTAESGPERGDIDVLWRNLGTGPLGGTQGQFELKDQYQNDDHNVAAFYIRPNDGRYLAVYGGHFADRLMRYRISTNPNDPTSWGPEQTLNASANNETLTYSNVYYLPDDNNGAGRLYNFTRTTGWDPNVLTSDDHGSSWTYRGKLLTEGNSGDRPYVRYAADDKKIHFTSTEKHPINFQGNSIYHGYVQDGALYNTHGEVVDENIFDASGESPTKLTPVFKSGQVFNGTPMTRAWNSSTEIDNTGNPVITFSARANDNSDDRRLFYGRFDGDSWHVNEMAKAGDSLYDGDEYTGLSMVDPDNPNVVYMSTEIDPITGVATTSGMYEIYKGVTNDFGATWAWTAITENSTMDNLRPIVPDWNGENTAVTWMRGEYIFWEDRDSRDGNVPGWDTQVVGINFAATDPKSQLWKGSASNTWDVNGALNWDSGGGTTTSYNNGDEVAFDDTASSTTVNLPTSVVPNGVAFNNASSVYEVTGAGGIGGNGKFRVLGGGTVRLNNGANTYTGDTLVARGTLELSAAATINNSAHIKIKQGGTLAVSGLSSTFSVGSNQMLSGEGTVTGNASVESGATLRIGGSGTLAGEQQTDSEDGVTYVDAVFTGSNSNTTLADGTPMNLVANRAQLANPEDYFNKGDSLDPVGQIPHWLERPRGAANGGSVFVASADFGGTNVDVPVIKTAVDGLEAGTYRVFGFYFGRGGGWDASFGLTEAGLAAYPDSGVLANDPSITYAPGEGPASFADGSQIDLLIAEIGLKTIAAGEALELFIDDGPSIDRTWYEGIGYARVNFADGGYADNIVTFSVEGDLSLGSGSTSQFEIFATNVLDHLDVAGELTAGGTLEVQLAEGAPTMELGDAFDILSFSTAAGAFEAFDLPALPTGLAWDLSQLLTTGALRVGLPGDFNGDGLVDTADYTVWRDTLGQADASGVVDIDDYNIWKSNLGNSMPAAVRFADAQATVPEPNSLVLAGLLGFLGLGWAKVEVRS